MSRQSVALRPYCFAPARGAPRLLSLPKLLLCDLDGTLIDTMPILAELAVAVLNDVYDIERGLARELYLSTSGLPFTKQLDAICPGDLRNAMAAALFEERKPSRCRATRMPADTRRALFALRSRGVRIAISSNNGRENVEAFAAAADFPFDLVMGYGEGMAKGQPHVDCATKTWGIGRDDMIFVGDSLHDGEIAQQQEMGFVGVASTFPRERFALRFPGVAVVRRMAEIPDLFA